MTLPATWILCSRHDRSRGQMPFCPVPHTTRDQVWMGVGLAVGACLSAAFMRRLRNEPDDSKSQPTENALAPLVHLASSLTGRKQTLIHAVPRRLFKLAIKSEVDAFKASGRILSSLDMKDGFVHLSDRSSPPKVASLFFKDSTDLYLIEIDSTKLSGSQQWIIGVMGDRPPAPPVLNGANTTVHYLAADGCVHVYGSSVEWSAVAREPEAVPLGADGIHVMPTWL